MKVLGLAWQEERLLAAEVAADNGEVKGVRPLGGAVEFGETREQALEREFREELGCDIAICGPWLTIENVFEHEGVLGHEFVFASNILLNDTSYYERQEIQVVENDETVFNARWFDPRNLPKGVVLYPRGLAEQLAAIATDPAA